MAITNATIEANATFASQEIQPRATHAIQTRIVEPGKKSTCVASVGNPQGCAQEEQR
jgi:hypothetical protein